MIPDNLAHQINSKIRILCIDDNQELSAMLDLYQKGAAIGPPEPIFLGSRLDHALKQIGLDQPDIVVVDLSVEGSDPLHTIEEIRRHFPSIRIILYSSENNEDSVTQAMRAGAFRHVHKDHGVKTLFDAILAAVTAN